MSASRDDMHSPVIRAATADDTDAVVGLLRLMHRSGEAPYGAFSEARVRAQVADCLDRGAVLVSLHGEAPVATLGLAPVQPWWSDDWMLSEFFVFVHPGHRRAPHARIMLATAKDIAKRAGAPLISSLFSTVRTQGKVRLFQRELGRPVGAIFMVGG